MLGWWRKGKAESEADAESETDAESEADAATHGGRHPSARTTAAAQQVFSPELLARSSARCV